MDEDLYRLRPEDVVDPPRRVGATLRRLGPGIVLAGSIVGSGELIATTTLGAQVGYVALWVVLLSCAVKPVVQAELGRYTIATGETALEAFDRVPGPRLGVGWLVWVWALVVMLSMLQVGGMFGGLAQVMNLLVPAVPVPAWVAVFVLLTLAILLGGGYERMERLAMVKVALFTLVTVLAAVVLSRMDRYFSWTAIGEGLHFRLPPQGLVTAVAVFGITGVGASELCMYPYWCVEKGYARFTGPRDGSAAWRARAAGWIRVMHIDIFVSMATYTLATVAFYLLGAGVLHGMGVVPSARDMIPVLSHIYTETLGPWALWLFYAGALVTLYGTIVAMGAAQSRMFADMMHLLGRFERQDYRRRLHWRRVFVLVLILVPAMLYAAFASPVKMVVAGGVAQAALLPLLGGATLYLRYRHLPREVRPPAFVTAGLWLATALMTSVVVASLWMALA
ncbi:MAG TPA: Nramp family divalent metal transporter [Vicinamibacteria bacterium]|nr:Nramp family divalent metal transporter [Vicinamibacteria bacterium]